MNYIKMYNDLCNSRKILERTRGDITYYEKHHIKPRCLGGSDDDDNMVLLTFREHFIVHKLLYKYAITELTGIHKRDLIHSFNLMIRKYHNDKVSNSRVFEQLRMNMIIANLGENNPNWRGGRFKLCPVCKEKEISIYRNQNTCRSCRDMTGEKNPFFGKKHTQESIESMKSKLRENGNKNNTQKLKVIIDNVEYSSMSVAATSLGCVTATIRNRINNSNFPNYKLG